MNNYKNNDGEIFFVSDLEGCYVQIRNSKQSRLQCSDIFFDTLRKHLKIKPKNKVAFLGDYFEGPEFLTSITKIVKLHQDFPEKVYIILGNRDVNKLRLLFELDQLTCTSSNKNITSEFSNNTSKINYWGTWLKFYPEYLKALKDKNKNNEKRFTLFKIILDMSMGTVPDYQTVDSHYKIMYKKYNKHILEQSTNINEKNLSTLEANIKNNMINGKIKNQMSNLLKEYKKNINSQNNNSKKLNPIMYLFDKGSLVSYDKDYKVLMSHGGGIDAVPTQDYYLKIIKSIIEKKSLSNNALDYFKNIEIARKELMKIPIYSNSKNNNTKQKPTDISKLIEVGNLPLRNFMVKPSIDNPYYYILQASGLKPDSGKPFVSFIHSCDLNEGFAGPKKYNQNGTNIKDTNLKYLKKLGVDFISFGHINFSLPIPLIYSRTLKNTSSNNSSKNRMVFIANDISNFRPFGYNIPISYIRKPSINNISQYETGVKEIVDNNNNNNRKKLNNQYDFMKGTFKYKDVPLIDTTNGTPSISYKKIKFIGKFKEPEIK